MSFRAALRPTATADRMSVSDTGEVRARTTSYGSRLQKQKSEKQIQQKTCEERLQELYLKVPAKIDVDVLKATIAEGEQIGVEQDFLDRCRLTLADAEKLAAKRREAERLEKLAFRCEQVSKKLTELIKATPLEADLTALKAALDETNALEEEEGPHKVEETLSHSARLFLEEAEKALAERRKAAVAALHAAMRCPLVVDPEVLRKACQEGSDAGVDRPLLGKANDLLGAAQKRIATTTKLTRLGEAPPAETDIDNLRKAWTAAAQSAASASVVAEGSMKLRAAEEAQRQRAVSSARLEKLLGQPAASLDQSEVREAKAAAEESDASPGERAAKA